MASNSSDGPLFSARYSDGQTAASRDVGVRLTSDSIVIELPGHAPSVWPLTGLATSEPLTDHAIDALLTCRDHPGATLFVPDGTFARRLAAAAPHLGTRAERWRNARPWMLAAAAVCLVAVGISMFDLSPARTIASLLPHQARESLGRQAIRSISGSRPQCQAAAGLAALDKLSTRLSKAAGEGAKFNVIVVDWGLMNAFATPGEQIVLTRGLLEKAGSADEVAGVLAHEMGHGLALHPDTAIVRSIGLTAAMELMLGGSGGTLGNIGLALAQISYTRVAEREADQHALQILKGAQVSPRGFADFFRRVMEIEGAKEDDKRERSAFDILRTHPPSQERRQLALQQKDYPATPALTAAEWEALRSICTIADGTSDI